MKKGILIKRKEDGLQLNMNLVVIYATTIRVKLEKVHELLDIGLINVVSYKEIPSNNIRIKARW